MPVKFRHNVAYQASMPVYLSLLYQFDLFTHHVSQRAWQNKILAAIMRHKAVLAGALHL